VLVLARLLTKTAGVMAFAHLSGISWRKGALTGVALAPLSVFVILLLEHARLAGVQVVEELRAVAAVTMLLEVFGPDHPAARPGVGARSPPGGERHAA
jgi:Kef-type K+ transport system membrane component KefB